MKRKLSTDLDSDSEITKRNKVEKVPGIITNEQPHLKRKALVDPDLIPLSLKKAKMPDSSSSTDTSRTSAIRQYSEHPITETSSTSSSQEDNSTYSTDTESEDEDVYRNHVITRAAKRGLSLNEAQIDTKAKAREAYVKSRRRHLTKKRSTSNVKEPLHTERNHLYYKQHSDELKLKGKDYYRRNRAKILEEARRVRLAKTSSRLRPIHNQYQRLYYNSRNEDTATDSEIRNSFDDCFLNPIPAAMDGIVNQRVMNTLQDWEIRGPCSVCSTKIHSDQYNLVDIWEPQKSKLLTTMATRLIPKVPIPKLLARCYEVPHLEGILLYPPGAQLLVDRDGKWHLLLSICTTCLTSLNNTSNTYCPKFSIANGFYRGFLPASIADVNFTNREISLAALGTPFAFTSLIHEQKAGQNILKSHNLWVLNTSQGITAPPGMLIPRYDACSDYNVLLCKLSPAQRIKVEKECVIRAKPLAELINHNLLNNPEYFNAVLSMDRLCEIAKSNAHIDTLQDENIPHFATSHREYYADLDSMTLDNRDTLFSRVEQSDGSNDTFVYRKSNQYFNTPKVLEMIFPQNFSFGLGGFSNKERYIHVSEQSVMQHYLRSHQDDLTKNAAFILFAFDHIARNRAFNHAMLHCRLVPQNAISAARCTKEELDAYIDKEKEILEERKRGFFPDTKADSNTFHHSTAKEFIRSVRKASPHFFNSPEEKQGYRRIMYAYAHNFGRGHVFLSCSVNDYGSLSLSHFVNSDQIDLVNVTRDQMPSKEKLYQTAISHPVANALMFEMIMQILLHDVIGFDRTTSRPLAQGGAFGYPRAFCGGIEEQDRLSLHIHLIIWIHGGPSTSQFIDSICERALQKMAAYFDSIATANSPLVPSADEIPCPNCEVTTMDYQPLALPELYKSGRTSKTGVRARPIIYKCPCCQHSMTHQELFDHLEREYVKNNPGVEFNEERQRYLMGKAAPILQSESLEQNTFDRHIVQRKTLTHDDRHHGTCFLHSQYCRFSQPFDPRRFTAALLLELGEYNLSCRDISLVAKRYPGCEYLNTASRILNAVTKTNSDFKFIGAAMNVLVEYTYNYSTKYEHVNEALLSLLAAAFHKRQLRELKELQNKGLDATAAATDEIKIGKGRIASLLYHNTNMIKTGIVMATWYIFHGTSQINSHDVAYLNLGEVLSMVNEEPIECTINEHHGADADEVDEGNNEASDGTGRGKTMNIYPKSYDYMLRPKELEHLNYWSFIKKHALMPSKAKIPNGFRLLPEHPKARTHVVKERPCEVVVVTNGPQFPNREHLLESQLDDVPPSVQELRRQYVLFAYILCVPFRFEDIALLRNNPNLWEDFQSGVIRISEEGIALLNYRQEYFKARNESHVMRKHFNDKIKSFDASIEAERPLECSDGIAMVDVDDRSVVSGDENANIVEFDNATYQTFDELKQMEELPLYATNLPSASSTPWPANISNVPRRLLAPESLQLLQTAIQITEQHSKTIMPPAESSQSITAGDLQKLQTFCNNLRSPLKVSEPVLLNNTKTDLLDYSVRDTYISDIRNTLYNLDHSWQPDLVEIPDKDFLIANCKPKMTLREISLLFGLNELQHVAFIVVGTAILEFFLCDLSNKPRPTIPLRFQCIGEGGTGKSYVIRALRYLTRSWGRPHAIIVSAPTGLAASQLNGATTHHATKQNRKRGKAITEEDKLKFASVVLFVIDEISMVSAELFFSASSQIEKLTGTSSDYGFGGLLVLLCGDIFQMKPARNPFLFEHQKSAKGKDGLLLYKQFQDIVLLEENVRSKLDPVNAKLLSGVRYGIYTEQTKTYLRERVLKTTHEHKQWKEAILKHHKDATLVGKKNQHIVVPVVFPTNQLKENIAKVILTEVQRDNNVDIYRLSATFHKPARNSSKTKHPFSFKDFANIYSIPPNKMNNRAAVLDIYIGMPCTLQDENVAPEIALANGVTAFVYSISWKLGTTFNPCRDNATGGIRLVPSEPPDCIFVDIPAYSGDRAPGLPLHYPSTVFPIFRRKLNTTVTYKGHRDSKEYTRSIPMEQFNILQSLTLSIHKVQGMTTDGCLIGSLRDQYANIDTSALYVCWSRCKFGDTLALCSDVTDKDFDYFKPSRSQFIEYLRLHFYSRRTLLNHGFRAPTPPFPPEFPELTLLADDIYSKELRYLFTDSDEKTSDPSEDGSLLHLDPSPCTVQVVDYSSEFDSADPGFTDASYIEDIQYELFCSDGFCNLSVYVEDPSDVQ